MSHNHAAFHQPVRAQLLRHQPLHVGRSPRRLARITAPQPQHQRRNLLALALEILLRRLTGTGEVAHGFVPLVGHPDCSQFAGARQPREAHTIAPVRLHAVARLLRRK